MATAVTWTVTVTAPPPGIVSEPAIVVPLMLNVLVLAPPLTAEPKLVALANWPGSTSAKLAPVAVDGPALLITKLDVVVLPTATVVVLENLATLKLTVGTIEIAAVAVKELVPTDVTNDPEGMVFVSVPPTELVTTTVIVQEEAWGISVPAGRESDPTLGAAVATPALQPAVVTRGTGALTNPLG